MEPAAILKTRSSGWIGTETHNDLYGIEYIWLEFVELPEENIIVVRHEKVTEDGVD